MVRFATIAAVAAVAFAGSAVAAPHPGANGRLLVLHPSSEFAPTDLYVVGVGGDLRRITAFGGNAAGAFSPDGRRIAYGKGSFAPLISIFVANADGSSGERGVWAHVEAAQSSGIFTIRWAPDSRRVAYVIGGIGLFVLDVDAGSRPTRIVAGQVFGFDWSPDGGTLVYSDGGDIYVVDAAGGGRSIVVDGPTQDVEPRFSPDGIRIAFLRSGEAAAIYTIGRDGRNGVLVGTTPTRLLGPPSWSPDGSLIAFGGTVATEGVTPRLARVTTGVWIARADGSGATLVRRHVGGARFSPDGQRLLLENVAAAGPTRVEIPRPGAFVMNADGSCLERVSDGLALDWQPLPAVARRPSRRCTDLVVEATAPATSPLRGFRETIAVLNAGTDAARDVVVTQSFDADVRVLELVASSGGACETARTTITCRWASIAANAEASVVAFVRPRVAGSLAVRTVSTGEGDDSDPGSNEVESSLRVSPCWVIGSDRADRVTGTSAGEMLCGRGGDDVIDGRAGNDVLLGEFGADVLVGGGGRDEFDGGYGNDTIRARDGVRDEIFCGRGNDVAVVDRRDLTRECERVLRR